RGGENTSEELYVAPNGIKITAEINNKINDTGSNDARWYRSWAGIVNWDGIECTRARNITFTFPEKRSLQGALLRCVPRQEYKKIGFVPMIHAITYEISPDGENWQTIKKNIVHKFDEWGNLWLDTSDSGQFKAIRFSQEVLEGFAREYGFSMIRLYE
ncbi:MAG: hypothetical protein ACYTFY_22945, partial [Planctomycetota bacterium]